MISRTESRRSKQSIQLQPRDVDLLTELFHFGCMSREQIQALYFGSKPRANDRLRKLYLARLVDRVTLPCAIIGAASAPQVYLAASASAPLIAAHTGKDPQDIRALLRRGTPNHLQHALRIVDFRLRLETSINACHSINICAFHPERCCKHAYQVREERADRQNTAWRTEVYKPDAVFLIEKAGVSLGFAVEIDLGHTSSAEFETKLAIHTHYQDLGLFAKRYGVDKCATLTATVSAGRRDNLKLLADRAGRPRTGFTTFNELASAGPLQPIWHRPGGCNPESLLQWKEAPPCSV